MSALSRFSDIERTLQARYAITDNHKVIAAAVGVERETISRYAIGAWPIPAHRVFAISACQSNWLYVRSLAERAGAILLPRRVSLMSYSTMQLLATLVLSFGQFLTLAEEVNEGAVLTDEKMRKLEEQWEQMKQAGDALIEKARQQRKNKE